MECGGGFWMVTTKRPRGTGDAMQNHSPVGTDPPTIDSDRHLLARVRLRDSAAFEQLFGRYYAPLRQALGRMLGDDDQADDLTQETFLALYTHPPQLQNDEE